MRVAWADVEEFVEEHSKAPASRHAQGFPLLQQHATENATDPPRLRDESDVSAENEATRETDEEQH